MTEEEVRRVAEALDRVEHIEDPEERVRAMSRIMSEQVKRNPKWAKERREMVLKLHGEGVSYRQIAARVGTSLATVQDIIRGYTGSGTHRPKKAGEEA